MFKNLITKITLRPSLAMRSFSVKPNLSKQMVRYPVNTDPMNLVFGMASNLMRNFEREFDYVTRKAYDNYEVLDTAGKSLFDMADESFMKDLVQVGPSGERNFKLQLNLKGFDPEEIKINTEGQMLQISARKERKVCCLFIYFFDIIRYFIYIFFTILPFYMYLFSILN
jgi:hypothetical protein